MQPFQPPRGAPDVTVRAAVISEIQQIADAGNRSLPPLTDDLVLLDSGLDSLAIAILVARLEDTLGFDPFSESDQTVYPVTLGDLIGFYEHAVECHGVNTRKAG
jgi:acyl carrier protein